LAAFGGFGEVGTAGWEVSNSSSSQLLIEDCPLGLVGALGEPAATLGEPAATGAVVVEDVGEVAVEWADCGMRMR
jgi:hypothetical protein